MDEETTLQYSHGRALRRRKVMSTGKSQESISEAISVTAKQDHTHSRPER